MASRLIRTADDLDALSTLLGNLKLPITVEWVQGLDRSAQQNRLQFLWARETAEQLGDRTTDEVRCDWKLRHGVPILRGESPDFRETYDRLIKPLSYPQKLKAMQLIEVTSLMKVKQMISYLDAVERECLEQGIVLTQPDPELRQYHARYRAKPEDKAA
jgi:Fe-S cluster assembly scaffold protein SufB